MQPPPPGSAPVTALTGALVLVLLAWNNVVVTRLPDHPGAYVTANVTASGLLLLAARAVGLSCQELGLSRRRLRSGATWGGTCAGLVAAGYLVALAVPAVRPVLADARRKSRL